MEKDHELKSAFSKLFWISGEEGLNCLSLDKKWNEEICEQMETLDSLPPAKSRTYRWILDQLSNCSDKMPESYCSWLRVRKGSTYAQGIPRFITNFAKPEKKRV